MRGARPVLTRVSHPFDLENACLSSTETLLLPLTSGVVLPGMVVTATLETPESRSAPAPPATPAATCCSCRRLTAATPPSAPLPRSRTPASCPTGNWRLSCAACTGPHRAGVAGTGVATWVQVEPISDPPATERAMRLAREYRAVIENILEARGAAQVAELLRGITDPGQIADTAVYSPTCPSSRRSRSWRPWRSRSVWRRSWLGPRTRWPRSSSRTASARTCPRAWSRASASSSCASSSPPSARSSARARTARARSTPTGPSSTRARCPRPSAPPSSGRSPAWSGPASRALSTAGSGPGSTP